MTRQAYLPEWIHIEVTLLLCALIANSASTQTEKSPKLHTPAEIMKIMEASKITYEIGDNPTIVPSDSPAVLSNQMYLQEKEHGYSLLMLSLSDKAQPLFDHAEEAFKAGNFSKAITLYNQVLAVQPDYFYAMTLIGDAFFSMGKFDSAKICFLRSIESNFADYNAHWFLADTYKKLGDNESALREITIAHLLNVNHANLKKGVRFYRERLNRPWKEWAFEPAYNLSKEGNKVVIKTTAEWMGYAMVKAVWAYEPGYAQSMLGEQENNQVIVWPEEKEAIMCALVSNDKLKDVNEIIEKQFFTEFILYEVAAKKHPSVLVLLPRDMFMRVVEYVNTFH